MNHKHKMTAALLLTLILAGCAAPQTAPASSAAPSSPAPASVPWPRTPWLEMTQDTYVLPGEGSLEVGYTLHNEDGLADRVESPALAWRGEDGEWMEVTSRTGICGTPDPLGASQEGSFDLNELWELPGDGEYRLTFCVLGPDDYRATAAATFSLVLTSCAE